MNSLIKLLYLLFLIAFLGCESKKHVKKNYGENGNLEMEMEFFGDKPHGKAIKFYPDGKVWKVGYFKNGKLDGKYLVYYKNGQIEVEQHYKNDKLNGKETRYLENGMMIGKQNFKDGKVIFGVTFHKNGDTLSIVKPDKAISYFDGKIGILVCIGNADKPIGKIEFDGNKITEAFGTLPCLTKRDTMLLDASIPGWRKHF